MKVCMATGYWLLLLADVREHREDLVPGSVNSTVSTDSRVRREETGVTVREFADFSSVYQQ